MSASLLRARQLRQFRRHEESIALLRQALSEDSDNPELHVELALNRVEMPDQRPQALRDIETAIGLDPDAAALHALKSLILGRLHRDKEALASAETAVGLDPGLGFAWNAKAQSLIALERWGEAEQAARESLSIDPDDGDASNLLAHALRLQNRLDESEDESRRRLERDPENAFSFATAGWSALQRHEPRKAEEMFRESLRLDPGLEYARLGLREAYKARSGLYRLFLRWVFFLQKHRQRNRWLIVIGLYVAYRFGVALLRLIHPLAAVPLIVAYLLFAFGGWLASGLGHFLLLKDPLARLSLSRDEKLDGLLVGGLFFSGLLVLVLGATTLLPLPLAFLGAAMMGAAVPASLVFGQGPGPGRKVFAAVTATVVGCAAAAQFQLDPSPERLFSEKGSLLLLISLVGVVATTWLGMVPSLRRPDAD